MTWLAEPKVKAYVCHLSKKTFSLKGSIIVSICLSWGLTTFLTLKVPAQVIGKSYMLWWIASQDNRGETQIQ